MKVFKLLAVTAVSLIFLVGLTSIAMSAQKVTPDFKSQNTKTKPGTDVTLQANGCSSPQWKVLRLGGVSGKEDKGSWCSNENQFVCKNGIKDGTNPDVATSYWVKNAQDKICVNCGVHKSYQASTQSCQCESNYFAKPDGTCEKKPVIK